MYLKRLEFIGFKSFAAKTVLEFPAGVVAIVGPNGSGKSNIIDGLRWVLGEREAKNIRAERSENLIFSGTAQKARASMAQVTIILDNSSKFFPIDYSEVVIKRKINRTGTSAYFLNEAEVRLKDIIHFFSQSRLGTKGFSIINQGNSDIFITASPADRRMMMEEILGLRQYQLKRHDAELKLQSTEVNADKVQSLIDEILPHLKILRRQTKKWEHHEELAQELRELENQYFSYRLAELKKEEVKFAPEFSRLDAELAQKQKELKVLEAELAGIDKRQPSGDQHFNEFKKKQAAILNRRSQIQKELGRLEAELEFMLARPKTALKEAELAKLLKEVRESIAALAKGEDLAILKKELAELLIKIDRQLAGEEKNLQGRQKEIEKLKNNFASELSELEQNLTELSQTEEKLALEMRQFNVIFKRAFSAVEMKKNEMTTLQTQKNRLGFEKEKIALRQADLESKARQYNRSLKEFEAIISPDNLDIESAEKRLLKLSGDLASIGEIDTGLLNEAKDTEQRYEFLTTQLGDLKKAIADLKTLIHDLSEKLHTEFQKSLKSVNEEFNNQFRTMFNGGRAKLHLVKKPKAVILSDSEGSIDSSAAPQNDNMGESEESEKDKFDEGGLEIELSIPRKNIKGLDMLSGGERSLVSIAAIFALISVSPPPFLVLDEIDAALDENNTKRFADLVENFSKHTQFVIVTHNRATMNAAGVLYGVTMNSDGTSRVLSIKMEEVTNELLPQKP